MADQIIYVNPMDGVRLPRSRRMKRRRQGAEFDQAARLHTIGTALYDAGMCRLWPAVFHGGEHWPATGRSDGAEVGETWTSSGARCASGKPASWTCRES